MKRNAPVLVFIGPGLTSFEQLAASVSRKGIRTAWIGYPYSFAHRARARFFVPKVTSAQDPAGIARELMHIGVDRIIDIQASEYVLGDVVRAARAAQVPPALLADLEQRLLLTDKLEMSRRLAERGVSVPRALDATTTPVTEAVARLGLPIVVKGRVANGGTSVEIAGTQAAAGAAAARFAKFGGAMYEEFVAGETVSYAASYDSGGQVVHDAAYLTARVGHNDIAPPDRIVTLGDETILKTGRSVVETLDGSGLININLIRDANGRSWVHDVNLRPWGTLLALRGGGVDFAADYLAVLGLSAVSVGGSFELGQQLDVFPSAALGLAETDAWAAIVLFASQVPCYLRWTGFDYVVAETIRSMAIMGRDRRRRLST